MTIRANPRRMADSTLTINIRGDTLASQLRLRITRDIDFLKRKQREHELRRREDIAAGNVPLVGAIADAQEPQPTYLEQAQENIDFIELIAASLTPDETYSLSVVELRSLLLPSRKFEFDNIRLLTYEP